MGQTFFSDAQIADVKARSDLAQIATQFGAVLRHRGQKHVGSCPFCGGGKRANRFEVKGADWVCAVCPDGGDVIKLVMKARGCTFAQALEFLGGTRELSPEEQQRLKAQREKDERQRALQQAEYREREIKKCRAIWDGAKAPADHGLVMRYLRSRRLFLPRNTFVREIPDLGFYDGEVQGADGRARPRLIHSGPAMLLPFLNDVRDFTGLHITWLDPEGDGKASIIDPDTGEIMPSKKMRGHKQGSHIVVRDCKAPRRLFMGEGFETTLSVAVALFHTNRLQPDDAFWMAGDLGNLGGPSKFTVAHPALKSAKGHALRLPGPEPAEGEVIGLPDSVTTFVPLGDGDSERLLTEHALARAAKRYAREGCRVAPAWADQNADFNDMLEGA